MATPRTRNILHVPSQLCIGPTDLSIAYPHGGTALGRVRAMIWRPGFRYTPETAEEFMGATVRSFYSGEAGVLAVILREWDTDAIKTCFPVTAVGAVTGRTVVEGDVGTDGKRGGTVELTASVVYVSPNDIKAPGLLLYGALPMIDESMALAHRINEEVGFPVAWIAAPDTSRRTYKEGPREDLVL